MGAFGGASVWEQLYLARLEGGVLRAAHLARLQEALAREEEAAIAAAARPDPFGALARLTGEQRARVERALAGRGAR